jgi:hypothetical protein
LITITAAECAELLERMTAETRARNAAAEAEPSEPKK